MDRVYKVAVIRRDGVWLYWEPTLGQLTLKEIPTNRYYDYPEAHKEYRRAVDLANPDDIDSVHLLKYRQKNDTWYTLTHLEFSEDDRSAKQIMIDIGTARLSMKTISGELRGVAELSKLSRETRREIEGISNKLHSLASLTWNLQNKILEELDKNVQDTES